MKTCFKCKAEKVLTEFYMSRWAEDGLQGQCKACAKSASKARAKAVQPARKAMLVKDAGGACYDCGREYPDCCFDFHHRDPSEKVGTIGSMLTGKLSRLLEEAAKCDLLCANCHRIRHGAGER